MARTTVDIDDPILRDLKKLHKRRKLPLGRLISELLAKALADERSRPGQRRPFVWKPIPMGNPRVDLVDKDALWAVLDGTDIGAGEA
ncbi:MAG TPA: antitoxin [Myxococcota bacterium]|nr:antitoxin [Myxococcota bacterium]